MNAIKLVLLFLIFTALSLVLSACQDDTSRTATDDVYGDLGELDPYGALVIYWHTLAGADENRLLDMIDDFNAANRWDITVVGEYQGDAETLYAKILAGLPSGKLPQLVMTDPGLAATYAAQGAAVALSPYMESDRWGFAPSELDDFFAGALTSERLPQFEDERFSFPACRSLQVLYYNVDWLKELGHDAVPQDWEGMREIACAASNPADGVYGYQVGLDSSAFVNLLATQGAAIINEEATLYTLGGPQGQILLQFLQDLIRDGCAIWEAEGGPLIDFGAGNVLFVVDSTAQLPAYRRVLAEDADFAWTLSALPHTTEEPLVGVYGNSLTILRSTPEQQLAAWLFVKWLAEPEQQARWAREAACFPTRRSALVAMEDYMAEHPRYRLASQLLEGEWLAEPGVTAYAACRAEIVRMLYAVTAGESVEQWFTDARDHCNQALREATE